MYLGRSITYECLRIVSQSVIHQGLNTSGGVFERKSSMENYYNGKL